ncbi:MAG TPA: hypothetical protein VL086_22040 [Candidatus Nitrosotalea sp.]|nr:hypothetical protein [Candidatus Nitrosotalea sp.]
MRSVLAALAMVALLATGTTARSETGLEAAPVLKAAALVGSAILRGPHYTVDSSVPVKGFLDRESRAQGWAVDETFSIAAERIVPEPA